jgi:4-hydroxybenzoyl-CoA thioesterase
MDIFKIEKLVRFKDCDPAGIVFYPRYFEMVNDTVEDWFREALKYDFNRIHLVEKKGTPTIHLEVIFKRPSYLGDVLIMGLTVANLGKSSARVRIKAMCGDEERFIVTPTLVHTDMKADPPRGLAWPNAVRRRMKAFVEPDEHIEPATAWEW